MLWKLWHLSYNYKSMSLSLSSKWNNCAISPMIPMMTGSFSLFLVMIPPATPPSSLIYKTKELLNTLHAIKSVKSFVMLYITPSYKLILFLERNQSKKELGKVHDGIFGLHSNFLILAYKFISVGYYRKTMQDDFF